MLNIPTNFSQTVQFLGNTALMDSSIEFLSTHVAKIISTKAGHMSTSLRFLYDSFTSFALPEFLVLFKKLNYEFLTFSFVFLLLTLHTIF